jgi:hypothetical protein
LHDASDFNGLALSSPLTIASKRDEAWLRQAPWIEKKLDQQELNRRELHRQEMDRQGFDCFLSRKCQGSGIRSPSQ